jgi:uncharacterized membrane protein
MNKNRIESLSDGIFAVAMTLLVFDVHLNVTGAMTNNELWLELGNLWPVIVSFFLSFWVLTVFWINHNFIYHSFMKEVDRYLNLMNFIFLLFIVFIPFSANLFGAYPYNLPAALIYGLNILGAIIMVASMIRYLSHHKHLRNELAPRLIKQARIRVSITMTCYFLGVICTFIYIPISVFLYLFPIVFNIIPGTLNFIEKIFKFELS